ncbi:MAG: MBL fold metallo-hydrolase [Sandaracinaceae bacterium]
MGREFRVLAIDSGQGDCTLVQCPNGSNILIDCGSTVHAQSSRDHVREVLSRELGDSGIDALVLTHPDRDHYNWLPEVVGSRAVDRVLFAGDPSAYSEGQMPEWMRGRAGVTFFGERHDAPDAPSDLLDCGPVDVHVLAANVPAGGGEADDRGWNSNSGSIVLRFGLPGADRALAILTGDATWYTERAIREAYPASFLRAQLLRLGHHGTSVTSTEQDWVEAVQPSAAFSSAGHHASWRHPRCVVVDRVEAAGSLAAVSCHWTECGTPTTSECDSSSTRGWCRRRSEVAYFDTFSSGEVDFRFANGELVEPQVARGECTE